MTTAVPTINIGRKGVQWLHLTRQDHVRSYEVRVGGQTLFGEVTIMQKAIEVSLWVGKVTSHPQI